MHWLGLDPPFAENMRVSKCRAGRRKTFPLGRMHAGARRESEALVPFYLCLAQRPGLPSASIRLQMSKHRRGYNVTALHMHEQDNAPPLPFTPASFIILTVALHDRSDTPPPPSRPMLSGCSPFISTWARLVRKSCLLPSQTATQPQPHPFSTFQAPSFHLS